MRLELVDVNKCYDGKKVLNNINLKLGNVNSLGIIGSSGGGKSTLLRLLAGIEKTTNGTININHTTLINEEKFLNEYRKTIGVVFQSYNLFPHLTAERNVTLPLEKIHGKNKAEAKDIAHTLFDRFMLREHMHKKPHQLSGGQQQRVAIIRALSSNPQVLLLDEPTSALDPELTNEVLSAIYEVISEKKDLIMVTHHIPFAKKACDYMIFISDGEIIEKNTNEEFFGNPKTEKLAKYLNMI